MTFTPAADAYVAGDATTTNYGTATTLRADNSPDLNSYLRFDVQGLSGTVTNATLRIFANSASNTGYGVYGVANNTWTESGITYSNAPSMGTLLGSSGTFSAGTWTSVNVTFYITGNGMYNLAFSTTSNTNISFASRESGANAPQLVITLGGTPSPTVTLTPSQTATFTVTPSPAVTVSPTFTATLTLTPTKTLTSTLPPTSIPSGPITINYNYDPLNRLTEANYSNNDYYHYTYDAVGNRKTQARMLSGLLTNDTYVYDHANRIQTVNGVTYVFDDNGNLKNDGVSAYTYDAANQLVSMSRPSVTAAYRYNGLGDRLQETLNGTTTTFTMDLNAGLTQALSDGTNTYIYGVDRIAQIQGSTTNYFLGDALGSVRQMTDASAQVTYARAYDPYGVTTQTYGASQAAYGFTNEYTSQGLIYLRSRYYSPQYGRFLTKDSWQGDYDRPMSYNSWLYVYGNPINFTDPTGQCPKGWIKNSNGACIFTLFPSLPGGGFVITVPEALSGLFCEDQNQQLFPVYATPSVTPQPVTSTPGSLLITLTPVQTQVNGTPTSTLTPQPTSTIRIELYRAIDSIELAVVTTTGTYGFSPSGGGKYFAYTYQGVINFAKSPFNAGREMTITNIDIPKDFLANGYNFNDVGAAGPSVHFSDAVLPQLYSVMSAIRILGSP